MVLITEEQGKDSKVQENGVAGGPGLSKSAYRANKLDMDTPTMSITKTGENDDESENSGGEANKDAEVDYTRNYWEDEDDIYQEFEELDFEALPDRSDTQSIASDNSFYPHDSSFDSYRSLSPDSPEPISFFKACCNNNTIIVKIMIRQGVTEEEVRETDRNKRFYRSHPKAHNSDIRNREKMIITVRCVKSTMQKMRQNVEEDPQCLSSLELNNQTVECVHQYKYLETTINNKLIFEHHVDVSGLIMACYHGYVDVVIALSQCPHLDVNWQDNEGNTALITAAQAGHIIISNYLLNYFPGLDIERRNCHGFTALMKAAMQGRAECVRAIMLAGGDIQARDFGRKMTPREWALFTGRYETASLMNRLMLNPCPEQICDSFSLEWPMLEELVAQAQKPKTCGQRLINLLSCCPYRFFITNKVNPVDDGVLEHMVRVTTSISSPLIATACHTVCPSSPPCIGKRRPAVQEILKKQRLAELKRLGPERLNNYKKFFQNSRVLLIPKARDRRASLQPQLLSDMAAASTVAIRRASLLPLHMLRRSSVRPGLVVPKVRLCKAPPPSFKPERIRGSGNQNQLQIPKWDYKIKKIEQRQEEERKRLLPLVRRR